MRLTVLIPVYNEINTIEEIIKRVEATPFDKEIIVVDDGSTDGTTHVLQDLKHEKPHLKIIHKDNNEGKGAAIAEAVPHISGEYVVIQDADLEYYPEEYQRMIEIIESDKADVVYGSRFLGPHRVFNFTHYIANKSLSLMCNMLYNTILSDMGTGYKMFRADIFKALPRNAKGFGFDAEVTGQIFKKRFRVYEVPISYAGRTYEDGKKIRSADAFRMFYWLWRTRFTTLDVGEETLFRLSTINRYYEIFFPRVKHLIRNHVVEIGSRGSKSVNLTPPKNPVISKNSNQTQPLPSTYLNTLSRMNSPSKTRSNCLNRAGVSSFLCPATNGFTAPWMNTSTISGGIQKKNW